MLRVRSGFDLDRFHDRDAAVRSAWSQTGQKLMFETQKGSGRVIALTGPEEDPRRGP